MKHLKNKVTNNFDNSCFYTSSTGYDLKNEIKAEAKKFNKEITDFKIIKI